MSRTTKLKQAETVDLANRFSLSIGCVKPPGIDPQTIGKMGLKGVPGLSIEKRDRTMEDDRAPSKRTRNMKNVKQKP
jgi:ATP-dependent RNA helicase MSS116